MLAPTHRFKPLTATCYWVNRVGTAALLVPGAATLATLTVKGLWGSVKSLQVRRHEGWPVGAGGRGGKGAQGR